MLDTAASESEGAPLPGTPASTVAELRQHLADAAVERIVLAAGTYNLGNDPACAAGDGASFFSSFGAGASLA